MSTTAKQTKICFEFNRDADISQQIPRVENVLRIYKLSGMNRHHDLWCDSGDPTIASINLAAYVVGMKIRRMDKPLSQDELQRITARVIVDLCPEEYSCLSNSAFLETKRLAGDDVPASSAGDLALIEACTCPHCHKTKQWCAQATD